eukprot:gene17715-24074_t
MFRNSVTKELRVRKTTLTKDGSRSFAYVVLSDPVAALLDPVAALLDPVAALLDPVAALLDPVAALLDPVAALLDPVAALLDPMAALEGRDPVAALNEGLFCRSKAWYAWLINSAASASDADPWVS